MKYLLILLFPLLSHAITPVYLIDTGIFNDSLKKYYCKSEKTYHPPLVQNGHGTEMAKIILEGLSTKDVCIVSYNVYDYKTDNLSMRSIELSLLDILYQPPGIINLSYSGENDNIVERYILNKLLSKGFIVNIAAGNKSSDLSRKCNAYPACHFTGKENNVKIVGNYNKLSNYGGPVNTMYSKRQKYTSVSTAINTHIELKKLIGDKK